MKYIIVYKRIYLAFSFLFLSACLYSVQASAEDAQTKYIDGIFDLGIYRYNSEAAYNSGAGFELGIAALYPIVIDTSFSYIVGPRYEKWAGLGLDTNMLGIETGVKYISPTKLVNGYLTGSGLYDVAGKFSNVNYLGGSSYYSTIKSHYDIGLRSRVVVNVFNSFGLGIEGAVSMGYLECDDAYDSYGSRVIKGGSGNYTSYTLGLTAIFHI